MLKVPASALVLSALLLLPLSLPAEVDLEALSKKVSLWPKKVKVTADVPMKVRQADGSTVSGVLKTGTELEVVSVQPKGVEVQIQAQRVILPANITDLEARLAKGPAPKPAGTPGAVPGGKTAPAPDPEAVRAKFAKFLEDNELSEAELRQLTPQEIAVMPENMQQHIKSLMSQLPPKGAAPAPRPGTPAAGGNGRPTPTLQSRELTPFIKQLSGEVSILEGGNVKPYTATISFKDKDYYLLLVGAAYDEKTPKLVTKLIETYNKVNQTTKKYEIIYMSLDRNPQSWEKFVKESKMPWPLLNYKVGTDSKTYGKYASNGVPNLIIVDRKGEVISDANRGTKEEPQFVPREVVLDLASLLQLPVGTIPE
jgi:hypothetical protein